MRGWEPATGAQGRIVGAIEIGAKVVSHGRYVTFQMAEVAAPRKMFQEILSLIARLRARRYVELGCGREDLATLASSVDVLRGPGEDTDVGSWPPVRSAREQGPRSQARQSLRHLLAWCRRGARLFPNI